MKVARKKKKKTAIVAGLITYRAVVIKLHQQQVEDQWELAVVMVNYNGGELKSIGFRV